MTDHPPPPNVWPPEDRGLVIGHGYVATFLGEHRGELADLIPIANGYVSSDLREKIEAQLVESDEPGASTLFWRGFVHGVRAAVVEEQNRRVRWPA